MKKIKKLLTIGLALLLMLCMGVNLVGCSKEREEKYARKRITRKFDVEVPKDAKMAYNFFEDSFQDWTGYTVFTFDSEPTDWLNNGNFFKEKDEDFEQHFNGFLDAWHWCPVPEEYFPDFENPYYWKENGTNYLVYVPDSYMLIAYIIKM